MTLKYLAGEVLDSYDINKESNNADADDLGNPGGCLEDTSA